MWKWLMRWGCWKKDSAAYDERFKLFDGDKYLLEGPLKRKGFDALRKSSVVESDMFDVLLDERKLDCVIITMQIKNWAQS